VKTPVTIAPEALDFTRLIRAGETIGWAEATAEPVFLSAGSDSPRAQPVARHEERRKTRTSLAQAGDASQAQASHFHNTATAIVRKNYHFHLTSFVQGSSDQEKDSASRNSFRQ
jgi:hypothetical protein